MRIRALLEQYGLRPNKGLGQSFLHDESFVARVLQAADLNASDIAVEVGPGLGVLTSALAQQAP